MMLNEVGPHLAKARAKQGLKQADVAAASQGRLSQQDVSRMERGGQVSLRKLSVYADMIGYEINLTVRRRAGL